MNVGSDEVYVEGGRVVIRAAKPMDWTIREFCKVPIFFQGQKYYLRSKCKGDKNHPVVYELSPWPTELHEAAPFGIIYDEAYTTERDLNEAKNRHYRCSYLALLPFYPFLGLFWSGFKDRPLSVLGFEPGSITKASIALTFNLFIAEGIFVGWLAGGMMTYFLGHPRLRPLDWVLMLLLGADTIMRFGQSLKLDVTRHWGFCEWLLPQTRP
ncbi:MAG TPA: hypothetical protein VG146_02805 [Verrucomicrobiae bacterium]|nr:hypothetical protein [Verrucomicrobiae bacterium]